MELPFAGLHQLCAPMLDQLDGLPEPQHDALRVAFGLASGDVPDRFLVAWRRSACWLRVGARSVRCCASSMTPNGSMRRPGRFSGLSARRLLAETVLMLFAVREPTEDRHFVGLPELTLPACRRRCPGAARGGHPRSGRCPRPGSSRGRNPGKSSGAVGTAKGMTAAELAGGFLVPPRGGLPGQLEEHFLEAPRGAARGQPSDCCCSPPPIRPGTSPCSGGRRRRSGSDEKRLRPLDAEQLVEIGATVQFRHPLVRSAIYSGAPLRRTAGPCTWLLAAAMDPQTDPDRRAWHRALAADGTRRGGRRPNSRSRPVGPSPAAGWPRPPLSCSAPWR